MRGVPSFFEAFRSTLRLLATSMLAVLISGCAGMVQRFDEPASANQIPFTVEPVTPALVASLAQQPPAIPEIPPGTPQLSEYVYRIGPGDVLSIFLNQSLFADTRTNSVALVDRVAESTYVVDSDGRVFLPLHGPLRVAGLTPGEAYTAVRDALARFINQPQVNLRVSEYRSQRVAVAGEVEKPGFFPITDRPMTITEAVITAGVKPEGDLRRVVLKRGEIDYPVDVFQLLQSPDFGQRWVLKDGDVVFVPRNINKVYVLGEAPNRTEFIDPYTTSLAQILVPSDQRGTAVLAGANYLQAGTARPGSIFVIRADGNQARVFHLNGKSPESFILADRFQLASGDIVYVSTREVTRFNRFIAQILPSLTSLVAPVFVIDRLDQVFSND
ncbi:polysaccharide export outer membrane protein [Fontimonas thermophila]|uniref:Polysaccharide export outer membrane protein n=2 Tax=Fontimonas thermophila TaxID=1076937 RepID=A0A1I2IM17_9GAMM|nr:polysaccharide export outer membrane protein [Fontimonas thermophila]